MKLDRIFSNHLLYSQHKCFIRGNRVIFSWLALLEIVFITNKHFLFLNLQKRFAAMFSAHIWNFKKKKDCYFRAQYFRWLYRQSKIIFKMRPVKNCLKIWKYEKEVFPCFPNTELKKTKKPHKTPLAGKY